MTTQHLELSEHDSEFVRQCVLGGRYKDANEVVEAGLRLLEERDTRPLQEMLIHVAVFNCYWTGLENLYRFGSVE